MIDRLVLATRNPNKVLELKEFLAGLHVEVQSLQDFPHVGEIDEDGISFAANALKKAREVQRLTNLPALADDSGLEVYYLNGRPGVYSARYAGAGASDELNNQKLLREMKGVAPRRRRARFIAYLALVAPGVEEVRSGQCPGHIAEDPRGTNGFGYDPLFVPDGFTRTYAELSADEKNQVSHRARAYEAMRETLERIVRR